MALSAEKVPIFADTNLGTHIALDVSPNTKVLHFKRELQEAHLNCFRSLGKISINGLMVKRKSYFYHLPDSLPIQYAFHGLRGLWFVRVEACLVSDFMIRTSNPSPINLSTEPRNRDPSLENNNTNDTTKNNGAERILCPNIETSFGGHEKCPVITNKGGYVIESGNSASTSKNELGEERKLDAISENHSDAYSEVAVSVSGIIQKYFCDYEEVDLNSESAFRVKECQSKGQPTTPRVHICPKMKVYRRAQFTPITPPRTLLLPLCNDSNRRKLTKKSKRTDVGKRLLGASFELQMYKSRRRSLVGPKSLVTTSSSLVKSLVFEIRSDDDDE